VRFPPEFEHVDAGVEDVVGGEERGMVVLGCLFILMVTLKPLSSSSRSRRVMGPAEKILSPELVDAISR
jgi:hypothetical protein